MPTPVYPPLLDQTFGPHLARVIRHLLHGSHVPTVHVASTQPAVANLAWMGAVLACGILAAGAWWILHHDWQFAAERLTGIVDLRVRSERKAWAKMASKVFPRPEKKLAAMRGDKTPVLEAVGGTRTKSGATLLIRFDNGANFTWLEKMTDQVAATVNCPVIVEPVYLKPRYCRALLQRKDTLAEPVRWPWADLEETNFCGGPIPVAVDLNGNTIEIDMRERNALLGGEPGSGKTTTLQDIIAAAALDVRVRIHIIAGQMGKDFRIWEPICTTFVTNDKDDLPQLIPALERIEARMDRVYKSYNSSGVRGVDWDTVETVDLVVVDEPAAFPPILWKYLLAFNARGRASGLMQVLATQRPSSKIMDTDLRALYQIRIGHRLEDAGMLMTLGDSYRGFSAKAFGPERAGECWLIPNDREPKHCRSFWLTDSDLAILAARAQALRAKSPQDVTEKSQDTGAQAPPSNLEHPQEAQELEPLPTVSPALLPTLEAIGKLGPDVPGPQLGEYLELAPDAMTYRKSRLTAVGLVTCRSEPPQPGAPPAGRSPWLWTLTDLGEAVLSHSEQSQADAARKEAAP